MLTTELLSRIQFAFTVSFHILFPAFSIGLVTFLAIMEGMWLKTKDPKYYQICRFWIKIFALTFGMGVVSGIVVEFQLGTNWSGYTHKVGSVLGALFTYEVMTAFFIEAGFLGVMIFGWKKVSPKLHYLSTLLVTIGVTLSAFWIMSANSWMQTPSGAILQDGNFVVSSWTEVILNPSVLPRFFHMLLAAYLSTAFVIASISAYYLLKKRSLAVAKTCFSFALWAITILAPLQIVMGDVVGVNIHEHQPLKTAAIEGVWETQRGAPLLLFAVPNSEKQKNEYAVGIPHLASLINTHDWNGELQGLKSVSPSEQPVVGAVFYSFRVMVGIGLLMFAIAIASLWLRYRKKLYDKPWFLRALLFSAPIGFIALITGWITAETGRQPWIVYNLLRTSDAVSPIQLHNVIVTFVLMVIIYAIIFGVFYFRYLIKTIKKGPDGFAPDNIPFTYLHQVTEEKDQ